jgi:hypothetical protein
MPRKLWVGDIHEVNRLSSRGREGWSEFAGTVAFHSTVPLLGLRSLMGGGISARLVIALIERYEIIPRARSV